jgi:hypothetical protein
MIVLYVIGGWFLVGVVTAALFSVWQRACRHHDPVGATGTERTADELRPYGPLSVTRAARANWPRATQMLHRKAPS